jgi:hypothetical protein
VKIGIAAAFKVQNPSAWSGTPFSLYTAFAKLCEKTGDELVTFSARLPQTVWNEQVRRRIGQRARGQAWRNKYTSKAVRAWVRQEKPDFLLQFGGFDVAATGVPAFIYADMNYGMSRAYIREYPLLAAVVYPDWEDKQLAKAQRAVQPVLENAAGIFTMSDWCRRGFIDIGIPPERLHTVYAAPNWHGAEPQGIVPKDHKAGDAIRILFVGSPFLNKGGQTLIEGAMLLLSAGHSVSVHIACKDTPEEVKALPFVTDHGFCGKAQLKALYQAADVFVMPTYFDCFPIVVLEAMSMAVPVIARDVCSLRETVHPGKNGALLRTDGSPQELASLILQVTDPAVYTDYSANAVESAETYSWDRIAETMLNTMRETGG